MVDTMVDKKNEIDVNEIMEYLPHRYPFLLIDKIVDYTPSETLHAIKNVTINEPFFQGHFPVKPIMPGVLILEALAQATGILGFKSLEDPETSANTIYYFVGIDKARFRQPVVPGDCLDLKVTFLKAKRGIWAFDAKAYVEDKLVCQAEIMCTRREA